MRCANPMSDDIVVYWNCMIDGVLGKVDCYNDCQGLQSETLTVFLRPLSSILKYMYVLNLFLLWINILFF